MNKIRCRHCNDIIESTHVHDFKYCKCRSVAIDGGHEYQKITFKSSLEEDVDTSLSEELFDKKTEIRSESLSLYRFKHNQLNISGFKT